MFSKINAWSGKDPQGSFRQMERFKFGIVIFCVNVQNSADKLTDDLTPEATKIIEIFARNLNQMRNFKYAEQKQLWPG